MSTALDTETRFLAEFEKTIRAAGVLIERRESVGNDLMGGVTYVYKLGDKRGRWQLYPVHTFIIEHMDNLPLAVLMAQHACMRFTEGR